MGLETGTDKQMAVAARLYSELSRGATGHRGERADPPPDGVPIYQGVRIDRRLIRGQIEANGFRLVGEHEPVPQRYMLVFEES